MEGAHDLEAYGSVAVVVPGQNPRNVPNRAVACPAALLFPWADLFAVALGQGLDLYLVVVPCLSLGLDFQVLNSSMP